MKDASDLLDRQLQGLNRVVLRSGGSVSMSDAKTHAEREYAQFKARQAAIRHAEADRSIAALRATQKSIPKSDQT